MNGLNKVQLIGNLGKDPDCRYTPDGTAVATLTVATNESYKDNSNNKQSHTEWHRVILWSHQAEFAKNYLGQGRLVYVEGKLKTRKYQQNGEDRYVTEIHASRIESLSGGEHRGAPASEPAPRSQGARSGGNSRQQAPSAPAQDFGGGASMPPDDVFGGPNDIPF